MHILCTQKLVAESSPKPLVAQRRTRLELRPRRARRAGQPEETPGGGGTGRPGRPTRPAGRARRRRERRTTASGGNPGRRDDRETGRRGGGRSKLRTTSITIDGTTCRSAGRGRPRADAVRVGGNPAPSRSGTSAADGQPDGADGPTRVTGGSRCDRRCARGDPRRRRTGQPGRRRSPTNVRSHGQPPWAGRVRPAARTGGRAAGPLDLIHRGALRLFPGCPAGQRRCGTDTARRASHRPGRHGSAERARHSLRSTVTDSRPERGGACDFHGRITPEYAPGPRRRARPGRGGLGVGAVRGGPRAGQGPSPGHRRARGRRPAAARRAHALEQGARRRPALASRRHRLAGTASTGRAGSASTDRSPSPRTPYAGRPRPSTPPCSSPSSSTQRP